MPADFPHARSVAGPRATGSNAIAHSERESREPLELLGTEPEAEFNDLAELAAAICWTPISLVTLFDAQSQYHKGSVGCRLKQVPRGETFCEHTLRGEGMFVVGDAGADARFREHSMVTGRPGIRFYAGVPLYAPSGLKVGALCVIDTVKRELKAWQTRSLVLLAQQVNARIELRVRRYQAERALESAAGSEDLFATFANNIPFECYLKDIDHRLLFYNAMLARRFGVTQEEWLGKTSRELWPEEIAGQLLRSEQRVFESGMRGELDVHVPAAGGVVVHYKLYQVPCCSVSGERRLAVMAVELSSEMRQDG
jgi:PAS domain S-box-containing protein